MIKLGFFGDPTIQHYAVADRLWELISVLIDKKFKFKIISLGTSDEVIAAFEAFKKDRSFIGFSVAVPWKDLLVGRVDKLEEVIDLPTIDTVYKNSSGLIIGANTKPLAAQLALETKINLYKCKSALVIGEKGAGLSMAYHLSHNLNKKTYLYDPLARSTSKEKDIVYLSSLSDLAKQQYDLIINTSPLGRYFFDKQIEAFTSPLDLETLKQVSHEDTVVQETSHLPSTTLLLQMAQHLNLRVVNGDLMFVFEALENLKRYFGITLDENTVHMLVDEIDTHIIEREAVILEQVIS